MPPAVIDAMTSFRASLDAQERSQSLRMAQAWLDITRSLDGELDRLALEAANAHAAGRPLTLWHVSRMERYQSLMRQVGAAIREFQPVAVDEVTQAQALMARWGIDHSQQLIAVQQPGITGQFDRLPVEAVKNMVGNAGNAGDGTPLGRLLRTSFADATPDVAGALVRGVALGWHPTRIARAMRDAVNITLDRAIAIARTETARVYRESSRQQYIASRVVEGYIRIAAKSSRTCFPAGTMIATANGERPIEQLSPGDMVWTGKGRLRPVTETLKRDYDGEYIALRTVAGQVLTATSEHPILVERQGQLQWVAASNIIVGDSVIRSIKARADNFNHFGGDISIKRRVWEAHDNVATGIEAESFAPVAIGSLMPVDTINFQSNVDNGQEEINGVAINRSFLHKFNAQDGQYSTRICFRFGFPLMTAIASRAAKLLIGHGGDNTERFTALLAGVYDWWTATNFRTIPTVLCAAKSLAASGAYMIDFVGHLPLAGFAATTSRFDFGRVEQHDFSTVSAGFFDFNRAIEFVARTAAKGSRSGRVIPESLAAKSASRFNSFLLMDSATLLATTKNRWIAAIACHIRRWSFNGFSANGTGGFNS